MGCIGKRKLIRNWRSAALTQAGEIDPNSAKMHVLIGDVFRQKRRWSEAEGEYRKALAIDPRSNGARLSLAIVLFTELKTDESSEIAKSLLAEKRRMILKQIC